MIRSLHVPRRGQAHWADQRVPFFFFPSTPNADPFDSVNNEFGEAGRERKRRLERMSECVELLFAAQHRVFLFAICIIGRRFRLIRWDRAGIIATHLTDYYKHSATLCDFLRRLSLLDDGSLGYDPTATRLLCRDPDFIRMDLAAALDDSDMDHSERQLDEGELNKPSIFRYVRSMFRGSLSSDWPRYRVRVPDGRTVREYLVGKPITRGSGVIGRGTRGYVALDCVTGYFVWLKDVWRASAMVAEREGDILRELNEASIQHIPTLICHGDIEDQTTVSELWWERQRATGPTVRRSPSTSLSSSPTSTSSSVSGRKRKRSDDPQNNDGRSGFNHGRALFATADSPCPLQRYTHYRIVFEEVAMSLENFRCGKQLASIVMDCMCGKKDFIVESLSR